jgi:hypothetical protein
MTMEPQIGSIKIGLKMGTYPNIGGVVLESCWTYREPEFTASTTRASVKRAEGK